MTSNETLQDGCDERHDVRFRKRWRCLLRVNRYRSLRAENRSLCAVPRKRRQVRALASVAIGHGGCRRGPLQRSVMIIARYYRSIGWATLAFEGGFPTIAFDIHLQDRGVVHEPVGSCIRTGNARFAAERFR